MGYRMDLKDADGMFAKFQEEYEIWVPKCFVDRGRCLGADPIKYARVDRAEKIRCREKSDFPAKGVLSPITQSLFYFIEDEFVGSKTGSKELLIFMQPCDIYAQHHQEKIYPTNGDHEGIYYRRMNEKVKIVMMEYGEGWDTCSRVSVGTNKTDNYFIAVRFGEDGLEFQIRDRTFASYLEGMEECPSEPQFVEKNELTLIVPEIPDKEVLAKLKERPMWRQFDDRCIFCGVYTATCSTRTYFTTADIIYNENRSVGERKRISASCQVKDFIDTTGGMSFRNRTGDRMRYKVLHKSRDYRARSKDYHMCVGHGRYTDRCLEYISIVATVNKMVDAIEEIKTGKQVQKKECNHE